MTYFHPNKCGKEWPRQDARGDCRNHHRRGDCRCDSVRP